MRIENVDIRRFFRNRFEHYWDTDFTSGGDGIDGSKLTLADCCVKLLTDQECFPVRYDLELKFLYTATSKCYPPANVTYGDVAHRVMNLLAMMGEPPASAYLTTHNSSSGATKPASELL